MPSYGGGNPWQAAANAYGSDLDQYNQIAMQGMQDRANAPSRLYQAFMQSYQQALDRKMQEEELARRNRLAEIQEERQNEQERRNRMLDRFSIMDRMSSGLAGTKESYEQMRTGLAGSGMENLLPEPETTYTPTFEDDATEPNPSNPLRLRPASEAIPNLKYPMGSSFRMKKEKEAQDQAEFERKQAEIERKARESEKDRDLQRAQVYAMFQQGNINKEQLARMSDDTKRWLGGLMAQTRLAQMDDKFSREREKLDAKHTEAYNKERTMVESATSRFSQIRSEVEKLQKAEGLGRIVGLMGAIPNMPGSPAADAQASYDFIRSAETLRGLTDLRAQSKTGGAVGNVSDKDMQILMDSIGALQRSQGEPAFRENLKKLEDRLRGLEEKAVNGFVSKWETAGSAPRPKALPGVGGGEADLRRQAEEAIRVSPNNANAIRASFRAKTGKDL